MAKEIILLKLELLNIIGNFIYKNGKYYCTGANYFDTLKDVNEHKELINLL